jgi:hypothetical protein
MNDLKKRINISIKDLISVASLVASIALASYQVSSDLQEIRGSIESATHQLDGKIESVNKSVEVRIGKVEALLNMQAVMMRSMDARIGVNASRIDDEMARSPRARR